MSRATTATTTTAAHPADTHDLIRVHGARVNNLRDVSVEIPKRRLTVFTGVSGSGKSSLVFGTIAAESQRLINETYSSFVQGFMPSMARPEVDVLDGLTTAILVDQERMGGDVRSTVGTATDANAMLRILFSRLGTPHVGSPERVLVQRRLHQRCRRDHDREGRHDHPREAHVQPPRRHVPALRGPRHRQRLRPHPALRRVQVDQRRRAHHPGLQRRRVVRPHLRQQRLLRRRQADRQVHQEGARRTAAQGADQDQGRRGQRHLRRPDPQDPEVLSCRRTPSRCSRTSGRSSSGRSRFGPCPDCDGTRLSEAARSSKIAGINIADACRMQISDLAAWIRGLDEPSVAPLLATLRDTLDSFVEIGLGYLSLERPAGTLSGGEAQRTKMIRHLGSSLTDVTYVFDEPTAGLHPHDIERMNDLLLRLRDKGNTVLVVEHKPETIAIADHVVDLGPGAGSAGGTICFEGHGRGSAGQRHRHRASPRRPGHAEGHAAVPAGRDRDPRRLGEQPPRRRRRHPAGRARRHHRRGGVRQELAHPRLPGRRSGRCRGRGRRDRPGGDQGLAAQQPGHLHRSAGPDPQGVREGERGEASVVQRQLRGRVSQLQRRRGRLHRPRHDGRRSPRRARSARASGSRRRCWTTTWAAGTSARSSRCRSTRPGSSSPTAMLGLPRRTGSSSASPTWVSAT